MTLPKIQLSRAELDLISDASLILTKNKALEKVKAMLQEAQLAMQQHVMQHEALQQSPEFRVPPKISKGEQYLGLPWMILDYPRIFGTEGIFAIRSMFWWGHFYSSTLHLSGRYVRECNVHNAYSLLGNHALGIGADPWQHHFKKDNYRLVREIGETEWPAQLSGREHIKIAIRWPVSEISVAAERLYENWSAMLMLVKIS